MQASSEENLFHKFARESKLALSRNANVFIWWRSPIKDVIVVCFNDEVLRPLPTGSTMLRWFELFIPLDGDIAIMPVKQLIHEDEDDLLWICELFDDLRPIDGSKVLARGDYICCYRDSTGVVDPSMTLETNEPFFSPADLLGPFRYMLETVMELKTNSVDVEHLDPESPNSVLPTNAISPDAHRRAWERHGAKCVFTGLTGDTGDHRVGVHWIYPPAISNSACALGVLTERLQEQELQVSANLVTMRADVHRLWLSHAIGVDVDDNYRIIVFDQTAHAVEFLEVATLKFEEGDGDKDMRDECLCAHFRWTLAMRILRGHPVPDDMNWGEVTALLDEAKYDRDGVTPTDLWRKKWHTPVGRLALEHIRLNHPGLELTLPENVPEHDGDTDPEDMEEY